MAQAHEFTPPRFSPMRVRVLSGLALGALVAGTFGPLVLPLDGGGGMMTVTRGLGWMLAAMVAVGSPGWRHVAPGELDERERTERARAVVIGHRVSGICLALAFVWTLIGQARGLWMPSLGQTSWLIGAAFSLHIMVPAIILAWRAPVDEED